MTDEATRHQRFDRSTARPAAFRGPFSELYRYLCAAYLALTGWKMQGDWPRDLPKFTLIAAPHTSNLDAINMIAAAGYYRVPLKWMGKKELTQGPLGFLVKWFGCVPVDRSGGRELVPQMADAFRAAKSMVLAISPEGTRAATRAWRTGYYYIALAAGVPIVMSVLDYGTKTISVSGVIHPSGNYEADLALIRTHYETARGLKDGQFTMDTGQRR